MDFASIILGKIGASEQGKIGTNGRICKLENNEKSFKVYTDYHV